MGYSCPLTSAAASQVSHMTLCVLWEGGWHWDGRQWGQRLTDQHHDHSEGVSNCDGSLTAGAQKTQDSTSTIPARLGQHLSHEDRASTVWKLELKLDGY